MHCCPTNHQGKEKPLKIALSKLKRRANELNSLASPNEIEFVHQENIRAKRQAKSNVINCTCICDETPKQTTEPIPLTKEQALEKIKNRENRKASIFLLYFISSFLKISLYMLMRN